MRASGLLVIAAIAACDQPHPLLVCHNSNCGEPIDPEADDTLPALRRSLTLVEAGRPVIDGIEIDSFWRGSDGTCLFAHDPQNITESTPAVAAAQEIAAHFADPGPITFDDVPFHVLLELKSYVGPGMTDRHSPEQRELHARCAWDLYTTIADAGVANGRDVVVEFEAFYPELLHAVIATTPASTPVPYTFGAIQGIPAPLDNQTRPLQDYKGLPITVVEFHDQWITDAQYEGVQSAGADLSFFMFSATAETFAAIRQYEPISISTSEARLLRRWIER